MFSSQFQIFIRERERERERERLVANRHIYSSGVSTKYSSQMTNNFIRAMPNFSPEETIQ